MFQNFKNSDQTTFRLNKLFKKKGALLTTVGLTVTQGFYNFGNMFDNFQLCDFYKNKPIVDF